MNARDAFLEAYNDPARCLCGGDSPDGACESVEGLVGTLLDAFAHELAERIRGLRDQLGYAEGSVQHEHMSGAADLIDPMKGGDRG